MTYGYLLETFRATRWIFIVLLTLCCSAGAQTVRPVINELGNPAKGRIEYVNDSSVPLNVVIETKSFSVSEKGDITYRPLDKNIHLKLSATSFRIPPQQSYFVFYEASSDTAPAWFVIYGAFSGFAFRTEQGMNVRVQLPHTVYLLPKGGPEKADVHIVSAQYDAATNKVTVLTENSGRNFGRVQQASLSGGRKRQEGSGFPVFPQSRRRMEYTWQGDQPPNKITLEFEKFKVEGEVTRSP
jgi:hypothetical protein